MTLITPIGGDAPPDLDVTAAENLVREAADALREMIDKIRAEELPLPKEIKASVSEYTASERLCRAENLRFVKERKEEAGIVYDYALDFDAARDEIRSRLARLRAAGDGGAVPE